MHVLLAFPVWLGGPSDTAGAQKVVPASDAFVISTLATLLFIFLCAVLWIWIVRRRNQRRKQVERWLEDLNQDPRSAPQPIWRSTTDDDTGQDEPPAPWEKPADWWKK